ncbi:hypothetical protein PR048_031715 [Dryococelus australis]|uniref:Uncharacterized protein n=1 Tax=Dryococelus australis TaxID=614101 RepID=A0ABQ9G622_9NEOP|nr:hypothetical protein PR048_031715 [Dryococelus australis]
MNEQVIGAKHPSPYPKAHDHKLGGTTEQRRDGTTSTLSATGVRVRATAHDPQLVALVQAVRGGGGGRGDPAVVIGDHYPAGVGLGSAVVRLLASHLGEPGSITGVVAPGFLLVRIALQDEGFLGDLPFPMALRFGAAPYQHRFTLVGSQHLEVKSRPNFSTQLSDYCFLPQCADNFTSGRVAQG